MYVPFENLDKGSRLWIFQSDRPFTESEENDLRDGIRSFIESWTSHNRALQSSFDVIENRIILLSVDENLADASGCSIDKMMHFIQAVEQEYSLSLLNRQLVTYQSGESWSTVALKELIEGVKSGDIPKDTLMYDVLISDKGSWDTSSIKPLKDSWLSRMI